MNKIAIVYWSGTGNTEKMANCIAEGAKEAGAESTIFQANEFSSTQAGNFDVIAFGCPPMGSEELEDSTFEPMFAEVESSLKGKKAALFGSYGWGDGQWMRDWCQRCQNTGINLYDAEGFILNETPDAAGEASCRELGRSLANW